MEKSENGGFLSVVKGVGTAVIVTLVGVLIFAAVVKIAALNTSVIKAVNQFIKILSVFLGVSVSVRGKMGLIKGLAIGVVSTVVTYLLFALIGGEISFGTPFFIDLLFGLIVGAISGVIVVNIRKD